MSRYNNDDGLAACLNAKVEDSKFGATIGSTTSSGKDCCLFLSQAPCTMTPKDLEKSLSSMLDENQINAVVKVVKLTNLGSQC